jgi:threonine dehydrogenase-like Zn-dependent dehydrogenase
MSDEAAVMVEPASCGVHAALAARVPEGGLAVVLGAGTLGLCTVAALRHLALPGTLLSAAKHREQATLAHELGADLVVDPDRLSRAVRRLTRSLAAGPGAACRQLTGGADVVVDCVGSASSLGQALAVVRPRGRVVLAGMPGPVRVDLAPLWQREITLTGAYTYGQEDRPEGPTETFGLAFELVASARLERLVSARYPLEDYQAAIAHAATSGRRGGVKVVFSPQERPGRARRQW